MWQDTGIFIIIDWHMMLVESLASLVIYTFMTPTEAYSLENCFLMALHRIKKT